MLPVFSRQHVRIWRIDGRTDILNVDKSVKKRHIRPFMTDNMFSSSINTYSHS